MKEKQKSVLQSKLQVYEMCYRKAEKKKDRNRMNKIEPFIAQIKETIHNMD
ncbi:MAG: hypothetical protein LKJ45_04015 [Oscillospiraceae bacterium]|nr:hypothetical protein [Oscillospiraceae bacterium]